MLLRQIEADPVAVFGSESWDYRIQPKDTLTDLAQRFLDDPLQFYLLAKYNRLSNPSRIIAGQTIKIPGKPSILQESLVASKPTPITPAVAATSLSAESPSTQTHQDKPQATKTTAKRSSTIAASPHESGADASAGRYYAVVIGIEAYEHLSHLDTAVTDAMAMTQVLEKRYGFDVILLADATRADILKILKQMRAILTSQDHLLIYYAGHGIRDEGGQGYWLPQDATIATPTTWLATSEITKTIRLMAGRHIMVIADSCYADIQAHNEAKSSPSMEEARQANVERLETRRSRTVLTSGGLKPVLDPLGGPLSVFAKALLTVLYTNDERLEGQQLFDQMRPWMIASSSQTPAYAVIRHSGHEGGDFMLVPRSQH
jgi:hypothetical protein